MVAPPSAKKQRGLVSATTSSPLPTLLCFLALFLMLGIAFMSSPHLALPFRADIRLNILNQVWPENRHLDSAIANNSASQPLKFHGTLMDSPSPRLFSPIAGNQETKNPLDNTDITRTSQHEELEMSLDARGTAPSPVDHAKDVVLFDSERMQSDLQFENQTKQHPDIPADRTGTPQNEKREFDLDSDGNGPSPVDLAKDLAPSTSERIQSDLQSDDKSNNTVAPVIASADNLIADSCDLFKGSWIRDPVGPLYRSDSCPVLSQPQNCRSNGRPDTEYENWTWQPIGCQLPRFDVRLFFQIMKGKTLAFVGDSVARNQMESLMCILWQVEIPRNIGNRKMQRWYFRSHAVTIIRIWSAWLVHTSTAAFQFAPENLTKLHLEEPDETFMNFLPKFDVLVLSSGHWLTKKTVYISNNEVVGGQLWWNKHYPLKVKNTDAFPITLRTALKAIVSNPEYKGLTIFRTFSPDHYEGGGWNTGGSCTGKTQPLADREVAFNAYTELMRKHQLEAFKEIESGISNGSKLRLMDITPVFSYRADGHPGPYRNQDPNKATKRGRDGRPPPQDCLHWCMPGPVDTWNEFLLEILRQELAKLPQKF